jgi:hypothetical protein
MKMERRMRDTSRDMDFGERILTRIGINRARHFRGWGFCKKLGESTGHLDRPAEADRAGGMRDYIVLNEVKNPGSIEVRFFTSFRMTFWERLEMRSQVF